MIFLGRGKELFEMEPERAVHKGQREKNQVLAS
jgi:hypothetical protein